MKKSGSFDLRETFVNLKRTIQRQIRRSYWTYLNGIFTEDQEPNAKQPGKNKKLWSYIKSQKTSNVGVSPLKKDGRLTSEPKEQAEILNAQFQSVFGDGKVYSDDEFVQKTDMKDTHFPKWTTLLSTNEES